MVSLIFSLFHKFMFDISLGFLVIFAIAITTAGRYSKIVEETILETRIKLGYTFKFLNKKLLQKKIVGDID